MLKKVSIIFLAFLFSLNSALLYAAGPLSLEALVKEALQNNPDILAAKKRYEASRARIPQAKSLDDPALGFTFEKARGSPFQLGKTMSEDRMLSISQAIPFFGKLSLKGKIALVESQMAASEYKNKELQVISEVKNGYYQLFMHHKVIELSRESLVFLKGIAKTAEARYVTGEVSQEELFKINLELAKLSNEIKNHEVEKLAHQTHLNTLLNKQPEGPLNIALELEEEAAFNKEINLLYKSTLENKPEVLIFAYAIEKNKYAKSLAKRSFFPDFMAGIIQRGITSGTIGPWDIMLSFTIPLWFWTKQRYALKEAIASLEEAEAAYAAMKNMALNETKDLYTKIQIAQNKIRLYKSELIPILKGSIQSSLSGFRSGKSDFMMLLDSLRMLTETKINYFQALVEYNMNLADLERAVGMDLKR